MSVASTVSRLPITVKVVPVPPSEEEEGGERQQESERDEDGMQETQAEEPTQAGTVC